MLHHFLGQHPTPATYVEHLISSRYRLAREPMTGPAAVLDRIVNEIFPILRKFRDRTPGLVVTIDGAKDVAGVFQSVDIANLVAIVCRDRYFFNAKALMMKLDDDFGIEMEIAGHLGLIDQLQGPQVVRAVAAVELGEIQA